MGPRLGPAMDLDELLKSLRVEKEKLAHAIASLEELAEVTRSRGTSAVQTGKRPGRKFMDPEERLAESARLKKYWENRRQMKR